MTYTDKLKLINKLSNIVQELSTLEMPVKSLQKAAELAIQAQNILIKLEKEIQ